MEADMPDQKAIDRIRRCLALARDAAGTPEGAVAADRAAKIAAQAGVDLASVEIDTPAEKAGREYHDPENSALWRAALAWAIAPYAGVSVIRESSSKRFAIIGRASDIALWRDLYARAEQEIDAEGRRYAASCDWRKSARSEGDTFRKAAAQGFGARLREAKAAAEQSVNGRAATAALRSAGVENQNALVLSGRAAAVKAAEAAYYPRLKTQKIGAAGSHSARAEGYAYGRGLGLHRGEIG